MTSRELPLSSQINTLGTSLKILSISATFPSIADPSRGLFVKERLKALSELPGVELRVISPTPWFPPIKYFSAWYRWSQYPAHEMLDGLSVNNSRYFLPPKIGGYFHPQLIDLAVSRQVDQVRKDFPFDLIDAHWVYPAGAWAAKLAQRYDVPVVMTGRGEDMAKFPDLPLVGSKIRWALDQADGCIGVSNEIANLMIKHGATSDQTCTIPNGIDIEKFHPIDREQCRVKCELPADRRILLSVGDRLELKGFHLVVEAISTVREKFPDVMYVIVGGPGRHGRDHTDHIESQIKKFNLESHIRMVGPKPHHELIQWYNAADLYVMMSSREGSPNVLLESLACGTPAVGMAVGGICDELADNRVGRLIEYRTAAAAAEAIINEFCEPKNRQEVATVMRDRTWQETAKKVHEFFKRVVSNHDAHANKN